MVGRPSKKVICGARRKYDGNPCQCKALDNGKCKFHGGMSTGQQSLEGRITALKNLLPFRNYSDEQIKQTAENKEELGCVRIVVRINWLKLLLIIRTS